MDALAQALHDAGGAAAPPERGAQLRRLLHDDLARGADELGLARAGYPDPVVVAFAADRAVLPVDPAVRADPAVATEHGRALLAAVLGALHAAGGTAPELGAHDGALLLRAPGADPELAALALDERVAAIDRLRAAALVLPAHVLAPEDLRPPLALAHLVAWRVAELGGDPVAPDPATEDAALGELEATGAAPRPHDDPDPDRRIARRILQRLHGMGKWGGYHTAFEHLARGFDGHDRARAAAVAEALVRAGLLGEKQSVGQRHVFLQPRRAADVHALIERGRAPDGLRF